MSDVSIWGWDKCDRLDSPAQGVVAFVWLALASGSAVGCSSASLEADCHKARIVAEPATDLSDVTARLVDRDDDKPLANRKLSLGVVPRGGGGSGSASSGTTDVDGYVSLSLTSATKYDGVLRRELADAVKVKWSYDNDDFFANDPENAYCSTRVEADINR